MTSTSDFNNNRYLFLNNWLRGCITFYFLKKKKKFIKNKLSMMSLPMAAPAAVPNQLDKIGTSSSRDACEMLFCTTKQKKRGAYKLFSPSVFSIVRKSLSMERATLYWDFYTSLFEDLPSIYASKYQAALQAEFPDGDQLFQTNEKLLKIIVPANAPRQKLMRKIGELRKMVLKFFPCSIFECDVFLFLSWPLNNV